VGHRPAVGARAFLTKKHAKKPVIVMNYPKDIKAFYMRVNDDSRTVAAMDVLAPGIGDIIDGKPARGAARGAGPEHGGARHRPGAPRPHPSLPPRAGEG